MPDIDQILNTPETQEINQIIAAVVGDDFDPRKEAAKALPYNRKVSVSDLVPEEYQMRLMAIDTTLSTCYWMIGDIADDLINSINRKRAQELGRVVTNMDIFQAVGFFCHRTSRTVRYYWETAHYFPPEMRAKYDVSFSMWSDARWVDDPDRMLGIAIENPQMSVEAVRAEYYRQIGTTPPTAVRGESEQTDESNEDQGAELPLPAEGEQWSGDAQPRFKTTMISRLDATIDQLRQTADRIPLPTEIRIRIADVLLELQDISLEIRRTG